MIRESLLFFALLTATPAARGAEGQVDRFLTPPSGQGATVVEVRFDLHDINEINDEEETFGFNGVLRLTWKDPRQAFDTEAAGVREKIYQGSAQIGMASPAWYPQVFLSNESGGYETNAVSLRISPDGTSVLTSSIHANAETDLSMRKFPFDSQALRAHFLTPGMSNDEVVFVAGGTGHAPLLNVSQWQLEGVNISTQGGSAPGFSVDLLVNRDPVFTLRLVGLPLVLIVMLSWSVFWMERSSLGDRISVSFVGILTAVAYQIVVGDLLPHVSYITVMHGFLNFSLFIMCASVVVNLVVGACDKNGRSGLGDIIDRRCRWIFPLVYAGLLLFLFAFAHFIF